MMNERLSKRISKKFSSKTLSRGFKSIRNIGNLISFGAAGNDVDFDEEGQKLFNELNEGDPSAKKVKYRNLDPIYRDPNTHATVYVGNYVASETIKILEQHNISAIVNCTLGHENRFENQMSKDGHRFDYMRFIVSAWEETLGEKPDPLETLAYVNTMLDFVDRNLSQGRSVLIHCLAGAHRAGTCGVLLIMSKYKKDHTSAIDLAKQLRPIINPISQLITLLEHVDDAAAYVRSEENTVQIKHWT